MQFYIKLLKRFRDVHSRSVTAPFVIIVIISKAFYIFRYALRHRQHADLRRKGCYPLRYRALITHQPLGCPPSNRLLSSLMVNDVSCAPSKTVLSGCLFIHNSLFSSSAANLRWVLIPHKINRASKIPNIRNPIVM